MEELAEQSSGELIRNPSWQAQKDLKPGCEIEKES
jgi:hypothetical protein